jgi:hypothetical protein
VIEPSCGQVVRLTDEIAQLRARTALADSTLAHAKQTLEADETEAAESNQVRQT